MTCRFFVCSLIIVTIAACTDIRVPRDAVISTGDSQIAVIARGWHTDISLPVDQIRGPLAELSRELPSARFLVFGFGERNYLMSRDSSIFEMLTALFPSKSAILLTALRTTPEDAFGSDRVVTLHVSQATVDRISAQIWQMLRQPDVGAPIRLADGPYPGSVFFASNETYDAFHTCNTWTALVLRNAGLPINPDGVLFTDQVMQQVRQIAERQASMR